MDSPTVHTNSDPGPRPVDVHPECILFHTDFDGVCSAAILLAFFDTELTLRPVDYRLKKRWLREDVSKAAVVDFLFHPNALWWFDHHETTFLSDALRSVYRPDARHRWDTSYSSCPSLVLDVLAESTDVTELHHTFREWIYWSDVIDAARYQDPRQAVLGSEPAILINQALAQSRSHKLRVLLVKRICEGWEPEALANDVNVAPLWRRWRERVSGALRVVERRLRVYKGVGCCDLIDARIPFVRYGVYYFIPNVDFSIIAYSSGPKRYWLSLSRNPWIGGGNTVSLAELASRYGGGGRKDIASVGFGSPTECRAAARDIVKRLARVHQDEQKGGKDCG